MAEEFDFMLATCLFADFSSHKSQGVPTMTNDNAKIEVTVTTAEGREDLFAELFVDGIQWGEVTIAPSTGASIVTIFPPLKGQTYRFSVDDLKRALDEAVARLIRVEST
jgi:hypothetical protein